MGFILALLLSSVCPPGFEPVGERCAFVSPYLDTPSTGLQKKQLLAPFTLDPRKVDLGRHLFFDPILSGEGHISCASCHEPDKGFSDGRAGSVGARGNILTRSAPSLWNVAFAPRFFWDGRAKSLEEQMEGPLFSPLEMDTTPQKLEAVLNRSEFYPPLFQQAYGKKRITLREVKSALAEFESSLISLNSPYDRFVFGEEKALSPHAYRGLNVFRSFVTRCTECHEPPLFTHFEMARIGVPDVLSDPGWSAVTGNERQRGMFRIPSLRNIVQTAPYMHSGQLATLDEVMDFYVGGGGRAFHQPNEPAIHWHIVPMSLTVTEKKEIIAFLGALTDESLMPEIPKIPERL